MFFPLLHSYAFASVFVNTFLYCARVVITHMHTHTCSTTTLTPMLIHICSCTNTQIGKRMQTTQFRIEVLVRKDYVDFYITLVNQEPFHYAALERDSKSKKAICFL